MLAKSGPEINPPTPVEPGPFLGNPHVILAKSGPEINPPTPVESGPVLGLTHVMLAKSGRKLIRRPPWIGGRF